MIVCKLTVYIVVLFYVVLSSIVLGLSIRYANGNAFKVLIAHALFSFIFFLDLPLLMPVLDGVCK